MFTSSAIRRALSHPQHCRNVIKAENGRVNAIVFTSPEPKSSKKGPLSDMSIAVKDNICTADMPTSCASEMLRGFTSPFDATVVSLLDEAGADIVGKANCDEFAMGSLNIHSAHGPVVNPFRPASSLTTEFPRSAGGSSGGSAAAVAAGMCDAALGTDTGGSVRLPASYCGVAGLKPSYGIISRWGVVAYADSLDCVGILGKRVNGVKRVFDTISKYDARDPTAALPDVRARTFAECASQMEQHWSFLHKRTTSLRGLRIGIPQEYFPSELPPALLEPLRLALQRLKARDATVIPVSLPSTRSALAAYYVIASAEASSNLARYDGVRFGVRNDFVEGEGEGEGKRDARSVYARTREAGFGKEVKKRILLGTYALSVDAFENYFLQAQRVRNLVRKDFRTVFRSGCVLARERGLEPAVDVLLHPSTIRTAPPLHTSSKTTNTSTSSTTNEDPGLRLKRLDAYVQDVLTVPASLAGLPALSVPAGLAADGWPVGISVVGNWGADQAVLHVGEILEGLGGS